MKMNTQSEYLKNLKKWGFITNPLNKTIIGIKNLLKNYLRLKKKEIN